MTDEIWQRAEIDSPCRKVCVMHVQSGLCIGCYRSGDEIARWSAMLPGERQSIMEELPARASQITARRRRPRRRNPV